MAPVQARRLIILQKDRSNNIARIMPAIRSLQRERITRALILDRREKLCEYWQEFCKCHTEIITREDIQDDTYITESFFTTTEGIRDECRDELDRMLVDLPEDNASTSTINSTNSDALQSSSHNLILPKINWPQFSGKYEDWDAFENRFTSLIHNKAQLSNVDKLQFLMGCLKGTAADFVKDVTVTDANYLSTWLALKERFSNLRLQVYHLVLNLTKIPPLKVESAVELRRLVDEVCHSIRMLKNLDRPVDSWDDLLVVMVSERLDPVTRKAWETHMSTRGLSSEPSGSSHFNVLRKTPPTFRELTEFLEGTILALSSVTATNVSEKVSGQGKRHSQTSNKSIVKSYHTSSSSDTISKISNFLKCPLCAGQHYIGRCEKFKALKGSERHNEIRRLGFCFNCFGRHQVKNCQSKHSCNKCQGHHHTMLHDETSRNSSNSSVNTLFTQTEPSSSDQL
ncbi:uncharacterized protein [Prorops nasuta]|uniref:uncharacterized protein n=1 Tax=Prorops nasuta TaxID=863751 RepID=UPI0034CD264E